MKKEVRYIVECFEYDRGWGKALIDKKEYKMFHAARNFVDKYNSRNTEKVAPQIYYQAELRIKK